MTWPNPAPSPQSSSPSATTLDPSPGKLVVAISGLLMFLFSFFAWVRSDEIDRSFSAWTTDFGLFPVSTFVPLGGLVAAALAVLLIVARKALPEKAWELEWEHVLLALSVFTFLLALGYLLMSTEFFGFESDLSKGLGYWINLLGSLGLVAGSVLAMLEKKKRETAGAGGQGWQGGQSVGQPPPPGIGTQAPQGYGQPPQYQQPQPDYPQQPQPQPPPQPQQPWSQPEPPPAPQPPPAGYPPQQQQPPPPAGTQQQPPPGTTQF